MRALRRRVRTAPGTSVLSLVLYVGCSVTVAIGAVGSEARDDPPATLAASRTPPQTSPAPSGGNTGPTSPPQGASTPATGGPSLTTAQIVAKWEPSVALIKGGVSKGTGFLVKPGIVVTNAHVIGVEFISGVEVRFPSASAGQQGPFSSQLLYEDPRRDLAFLRVTTSLPAIEVAPSYTFVKGEDITVIGNPSLGDQVVLENAVSRGVMSAKTVIDGKNYFQISMAINPGNSGGPVFDSSGRVVGVVTLKSNRAEAMAFCIPVEELRAAIVQVGPSNPAVASRHRARVAFRLLTVAGAVYGGGLEIRAAILRATPVSVRPNLLPNVQVEGLDLLIRNLEEKVFSQIEAEVAKIRDDAALTTVTRDRLQELSAGHRAMKDFYANPTRPAALYAARIRDLRADYFRQVKALGKDLEDEIPSDILALYKMSVSNSRTPAAITRIVPAPLRSRDPGVARSEPRGAIGPPFEAGVELFQRGEYREAYAIFRNLLQSQEDDARIWYYAALSYGLASGDWGRTTQTMAEEGVARERANRPTRSEIDDACARLTKETGKEWLDFYRRRAQ